LIIEPWIWKAAATIFALSTIVSIMVVVYMAKENLQLHKKLILYFRRDNHYGDLLLEAYTKSKSKSKSETQKMIDEILERGQ